MKLYLKTLTHLHIGTGTELEPLDYLTYGKYYYRYSQNFLSQFIDSQNLLKEYSDWLNEAADKISSTDNNKKQSEIRKNYNLLKFCQKNNKESILIQALNSDPQVVKATLSGEIPDRKIRQQITDGTLKPYIPGSSIKGAIRTALLYKWLKTKKPTKELIDIFEEDLKDSETDESKLKKKTEKKLQIKFARKIENLAFYCGIEKKRGIVDYTDEKFDLLKLLMVSDATFPDKENVFSIIKTNLYLQNSLLQTQSPWVEAIAPNCVAEFNLDFNINFLFSVKNKIKSNAIEIDNTKQWIDIVTKTHDIFGIDITSLTEKNLEEKRAQVINYILSAVSEFSKDQIMKNEKWKEGITSPPPYTGKIDYSFIPHTNSLNLGFASGFTGITELLFILNDPPLKEAFKKVMKKFDLGKQGKNKELEPNPDQFPKSRTLYRSNKKIIPLGWTHISDKNPLHQQYSKLTSASTSKQTNQISASEFKPQYYTGPLKEGTEVDAGYHSTDKDNPNIKYFKLFIQSEGQEPIVACRYASDIPEGSFFKVKINSIQKNKIQSIQIIKKII